MTARASQRIIESAREAAAIASGEIEPARAPTTSHRIIDAMYVAAAARPPRKRKPLRREDPIQADIVGFLRVVLNPRDFLVYANANASRRAAGGHASNGVPGLTPGIPDLSIVTCGGQIYFLEVKTAIGVLSDAQEGIRDRLDAMGAPFAVVRSIDDVRVALEHWKIPNREARAV